MSQNGLMFLASQLATQAPLLLVYMATLVMAVIYMRRAPLAASLALVGAITLMASVVIFPALQFFVANRSMSSSRSVFTFISLASSFVRAVGTALLVSAVFVCRSRASAAY